MIKKLAAVGVLTAVAVLWPPSPASAHVLENDGDIGAVLHIEPDDNPLAGEPVTYQLVFNDTSHRFAISKCDCTVTIQNVEGVVASQPLNAKHELDSKSSITFPSPDVYTVKVHGEPKLAGDFRAFTLDYAVRVNPSGVQFQAVPVLLWVGIISAVSLAILAAYKEEYDNSMQKKSNRQKGE